MLQLVERTHEAHIQTVCGNASANARLTFGQETGLAMRGQEPVDHADVVVVKYQPSAGEHLQTCQSWQCAQIMLKEMVHAFGGIHDGFGDDVGIAQRADHIRDLRHGFEHGKRLVEVAVDAQAHQHLAVVA